MMVTTHTDNVETPTMYLSTGHTARQPVDVRYYPNTEDTDMSVQVFLGDSFHTLYMSAEEARSFAEQILAALPVEVEVPA